MLPVVTAYMRHYTLTCQGPAALYGPENLNRIARKFPLAASESEFMDTPRDALYMWSSTTFFHLPPMTKRPVSVPLSTIRQLVSAGLSIRGVHKQLCAKGYAISPATVQRRLATLQSMGFQRPTRGYSPQRKLSARALRYAATLIRKHNQRTGPQILKGLVEAGHDVSKATVWRSLKTVPSITLQRPCKTPYMTTAQRRQRLQWARQTLNWDIEWAEVFFADEKAWQLEGPAWRPRMYADRRDAPLSLPRKGYCQPTVRIWGAFSSQGVIPIVFSKQQLNAASYCDTIASARNASRSFRNAVLFHDRHTAHTAKQTVRWLESKRQKVELLPPKAADINPIENL